MSRIARSQIANETVAICDAGHYITSSQREVTLGPAIREAIAGTYVIEAGPLSAAQTPRSSRVTRISVTGETTVEAILRLNREEGGHLACLNFASAKNPGGGFLGGAEAQEESLARSSGLYPCLLAAPAYYERNRRCGTTLYLDLAIWSPAVPFFRDDSGALLDTPAGVSVITAPAPNAGAIAVNEAARMGEVEPTLARRARLVLEVAETHGVRRLVLGAWGCGVFRNDPCMVARVFGTLLREGGDFADAFDEVVFAILDRSRDQTIIGAFRDVFCQPNARLQ